MKKRVRKFPAREMTENGNLKISDPARGIALLVETMTTEHRRFVPFLWLVGSAFRRMDNGRLGEPFLIEYGLN